MGHEAGIYVGFFSSLGFHKTLSILRSIVYLLVEISNQDERIYIENLR